jgi:stress response protein SCP2
MMSYLSAVEVTKLQTSCWYLHDICQDGTLWRLLFAQQYPRSALTAATMTDWKHCYELEKSHLQLVCFHSKRSITENHSANTDAGNAKPTPAVASGGGNDQQHHSPVVLGIPVSFTTNPRTRLVDQIYSSFDLLSTDAFLNDGVRTTVWNEKFTDLLPLYLTQSHFDAALEAGHLQRALVRLSQGQYRSTEKQLRELASRKTGAGSSKGGGARSNGSRHRAPRFDPDALGYIKSSGFHPLMTLEVLPKLMTTMVVLMADEGVHASDKAIEGYCQCQRLLVALMHRYPILQREVHRRIKLFASNADMRTKAMCPNIGHFLPLLAVSNEFGWADLALPVLAETFDRNAMWICKDSPGLAKLRPLPADGVEEDRLRVSQQATRIATRLLMFHYAFLGIVARPPSKTSADKGTATAVATGPTTTRTPTPMLVEEVAMRSDHLFGYPSLDLKRRFRSRVQTVLSADAWPSFFSLIGRTCPSKAQLTGILRGAVRNSMKKGYHSATMDFSRIQSSGVSKILLKGQSYSASTGLAKVKMQEVWHYANGTIYLDASALLYDFSGKMVQYVDYSTTRYTPAASRGATAAAVRHSGDQIDSTKKQGVHTIELDLKALPEIQCVYFTMSAWASAKLKDIKQPFVRFFDTDTDTELCQYEFDHHTSKFGNNTAIVMCKLHRSTLKSPWQVTAQGDICMGKAGNGSSYKPIFETIEQLEGRSADAAKHIQLP